MTEKCNTTIKPKFYCQNDSINDYKIQAMRTDTNSGNGKERILIKANYQLVPVNLDEILFIKALSDYVIIKTTTGKYITLSTMKDMVDSLPDNVFVRSHRSFIVNLDKVSAVKGSTIEIRDSEMRFSVPIGRAYKKDFKASLNAA
jgi:DNA-binding LytR/AlgR family response regulator